MIRIGTGSLLKKNKEIYAIVFVQDYLKNCENRDYKRFLTQYKFQVTLVVIVLSQCIPPPLCAFANRVDQQFSIIVRDSFSNRRLKYIVSKEDRPFLPLTAPNEKAL